MNKPENDEQTFYNDISDDQARDLLREEGVQAVNDKIIFYIQHDKQLEPVDEKPSQLITVEREDSDFVKTQEKLWVPVMSAGTDVPPVIAEADKAYISIRHLSQSADNVLVKGYSFGIISAKTIGAVK